MDDIRLLKPSVHFSIRKKVSLHSGFRLWLCSSQHWEAAGSSTESHGASVRQSVKAPSISAPAQTACSCCSVYARVDRNLSCCNGIHWSWRGRPTPSDECSCPCTNTLICVQHKLTLLIWQHTHFHVFCHQVTCTIHTGHSQDNICLPLAKHTHSCIFSGSARQRPAGSAGAVHVWNWTFLQRFAVKCYVCLGLGCISASFLHIVSHKVTSRLFNLMLCPNQVTNPLSLSEFILTSCNRDKQQNHLLVTWFLFL